MPIDPDVAVGAELPGRDLSWDSTAASGIVTTSPFGCRAAAWLL